MGGPQIACLRGHKKWVLSVAYSPDGRRIVTGSDDQTVRVWDAEGGVEMACLRGHPGGVESVAYSPDGRRIIISSRWPVIGSSDSTVRVWDAESGECLEMIQGSDDVTSIAAAEKAPPWRAMSWDLETVIAPASGGEAVAWFPAAMRNITTHPSGRIWAGSASNHLYLIQLEGEPDSKHPGGVSRWTRLPTTCPWYG